ncbi:MAG: IS66 family insertion sequence element accessory protein TnpB [Treponema sp.]|nr:IS66 family insertion sequence element accessory protein TnpB [Treponema sp.]
MAISGRVYIMLRNENIMVLRKEPRIFVKTGFTDMRKQINRLSAMVRELRPEGPFDGAYYLFCGKTRKKLKILYWERTRFCLCQKRLEKDRFSWPKDRGNLDEHICQRIRLLLKGIDIFSEHEEVFYSVAGKKAA